MGILGRAFGGLGSWAYRAGRRTLTGVPTSAVPEAHVAWVQEQLRAYATPQPYASPLTSTADNISGETWEMRQGYRRMCFKEPSVKAAILSKCLAVAQLDPQVLPYNKADKQDRAIAKWCKHAIATSDGGWPKLLWNVLVHSHFDGFSLCEKLLDVVDRKSDEYAGFWTLKKVKAKDTKNVRFRMDEFKNIEAVQNMSAAQGGAPFHPEDFLIFTHLCIFENPFGISDLRAANRAANLIESAIKLRAILLENFSGPYLIATAADPGARAKIMGVLREARARGWIVMPENSSLQVVNLATSAPDQFQNTIEDLRQEVVTAIQGAYLQLLEGGVPGGRGNTEVHKSIAELFQWWLAAQSAELIQHHLFPDIVYPNYGRDVGLPRLTLGGINLAAVLQDLERFERGQRMGVTLSLRQVMESGAYESPEDDNDKLAPPNAPPPGPPGGGTGGGLDMGQLFGGGGPPPGQDSPDQSGDQGDASFRQFSDLVQIGQPYFSDAEYQTLSFADRAHLVKKVIQDKRGFHRVVWVNPDTGDHGDERTRLAPRVNAETAVKKALEHPGDLTHADVAAIPQHLHTLTTAQKRSYLKQVREKVGGKKAELASRLLAHIRGQKATARAVAPPPPVSPPPPPPPPPPPSPARPPAHEVIRQHLGDNADMLSSTTYDELARVAAGTLSPETARDQFAGRLASVGPANLERIGQLFGFTRGNFDAAGFTAGQRAAAIASNIYTRATGRHVPVGATPASPPPPPLPATLPVPPPPPAGARRTAATGRQIPMPTDPHREAQNVTFAGLSTARAKAVVRQLFGRDVAPGHLAALFNAHDGATVRLGEYEGRVEASTEGVGYSASRYVGKDSDGKLYIKNSYFRVKFDRNPTPPPAWVQKNRNVSGGELLNNQIRAARAAGVSKFKTPAARADSDDPNYGMNGYYTWPRLGYDDSISSRSYDSLPPELKSLVDSNPVGSSKPKSVLNLMTTEAGRNWWKEHGEDLYDMEFDLDPDSLSMKTLAAYTQERNRSGGRGGT